MPASSTPFTGFAPCSTTLGDGLHPNAQGDLLMAGNLAKGMGYAGGQPGKKESHP